MERVKVYISNQQNAVKIPTGIRLLVRRCCSAVLQMEEFFDPAEVSVTFVDNEQIRELNAEYRNKDSATDVLSFPLGENGEYDVNMETGALSLMLETELPLSQLKKLVFPHPSVCEVIREGLFMI